MNSLLHRLLAQRCPPHPNTRTSADRWRVGTRRPRPYTRLALELLEERTVLSPAEGFSPMPPPINDNPPAPIVLTSNSTAAPMSINSASGTTIPSIPPALLTPFVYFVVDQALLTVDTLSSLLHQNNSAVPVLQIGGSTSQLQSALQSSPVQNTIWGEMGTFMGIDLGISFLVTELQQSPSMTSSS